jgi:hypothetical protein
MDLLFIISIYVFIPFIQANNVYKQHLILICIFSDLIQMVHAMHGIMQLFLPLIVMFGSGDGSAMYFPFCNCSASPLCNIQLLLDVNVFLNFELLL